MITRRPASDRGHFNHGWLDTYHTFSFGEYYDPRQMGFRTLRVINEDHVAPGQGFGMHSHRDMEILTVVLSGQIEHRDSLGNGSILQPGMIQRMTAGSGIRHSEFNPSSSEPLHLYQIWIVPERDGLTPSYEEKTFDPSLMTNRFGLLASRTGEDGSVVLHQDAKVSQANLSPRTTVSYSLPAGRSAWAQILSGTVELAAETFAPGDGFAVTDQTDLDFTSGPDGGRILLFDLG